MSFALKDAERIAPAPPAGQGITAIQYNDATQVVCVSATLPLDILISTEGDLIADIEDYVAPSANWADLYA